VSWTQVPQRPLTVGVLSNVPGETPRALDRASVRTSVIVPAFNEEAGVRVVIDQLREILDETYELIVVDDGSTDGTAAAADVPGVVLVRHKQNRGKGAALVTGFAAASGNQLITLDADGTYPAEMVPVLAEALQDHDLVSGVRETGRVHISLLNRLGNGVFRKAISLAARRNVSDPLTGLYGLRRSALERMDLQSEGFGIEAEIVIKAGRLGLSAMELPIEYRPRIGTSKLHPWRDGVVISRTIMSVAFGSPVQPAAFPESASQEGNVAAGVA
jgi:glycosyltransferase involved in cell wall biosynthesis